MQDLTRLGGLLLLLSSFLSLGAAAEEQTYDKLTYLVIANQAEPFQINTSSQQSHSGIISDIVSALAIKRPLTISTQVMPFKRYVHVIKSRTYPNWISYGSPSWQADNDNLTQNSRLSAQTLFEVQHLLVTRSDDVTQYQRIEDLFGKTVILLKGFDYPGLMPFIESGQIKKMDFRSHESALQALDSGRGDLFIEMERRIQYAIKQHKLKRNLFSFREIPNIVPPLPIHLSYGDSVDQELIDWIDDQVIILKATGQLEAIIHQYQ